MNILMIPTHHQLTFNLFNLERFCKYFKCYFALSRIELLKTLNLTYT